MRLYYIDESEGPRYYVRSALGVDAERWNELPATFNKASRHRISAETSMVAVHVATEIVRQTGQSHFTA